MANYYCAARTSYFKVKDIEAFEKFIKEWPDENVDIYTKDDKENGKLVALGQKRDDESIVSVWDKKLDDEKYLFEEIPQFIEDGWACIYIEAGSEKLRYLNAFSRVVTNKGDLDEFDAGSLAQELCIKNKLNFTTPEY